MARVLRAVLFLTLACMLCCKLRLLDCNLCKAAQAGTLRAAAPPVSARAGAVGHLAAVVVDVGGCHRDHQQRGVEKMWKLVCLRMLKMLLNCMLISCSRFATLAATDLRRAFGEHVRKRACVRVLWVARMRELTGDSGATGVRHCAKFILFRLNLVKYSIENDTIAT